MGDVETLVADIARGNDMMKHWKAYTDAKKAELREAVGVGNFETDAYAVKITSNRRFDAKLAKAVLTDEELAQVSEMTPVAAKVRVLYPELYDELCAEGQLRVTIEPKGGDK